VSEDGYYELQVYSANGALISSMIFLPERGASTSFPLPPKVGEVKVEYHPPETRAAWVTPTIPDHVDEKDTLA
jgi:hypothetical protein